MKAGKQRRSETCGHDGTADAKGFSSRIKVWITDDAVIHNLIIHSLIVAVIIAGVTAVELIVVEPAVVAAVNKFLHE